MITEGEIREKIKDLPELFRHYYSRGEYAKAKYAYDTACVVSVFLELSDKEKAELFSYHLKEEPGEYGENFYRPWVAECQEKCIFTSDCCREAERCDERRNQRKNLERRVRW